MKWAEGEKEHNDFKNEVKKDCHIVPIFGIPDISAYFE